MMWYRKAILGFIAGQFVLVGLFAQQETKNTKPETPASQKDANNAKDGAKKEQPKIDVEEKNEIKKWTKEKLLKEMGKANHTLSREGQEWLKSKVRLEVLINKETAFYDELKQDKSLALAREKLNDSKADLAKLANIKDENEVPKELKKILDKCELKLADIEKFIAFKDAEYTIKTGEDALAKISKLTGKALDIPAPQRRLSNGGTSKTQVDKIASAIRGSDGIVEPPRDPEADSNLAKRLLEALSR